MGAKADAEKGRAQGAAGEPAWRGAPRGTRDRGAGTYDAGTKGTPSCGGAEPGQREMATGTEAPARHAALGRAWEIFGFGTQYAWLLALVLGSAFYRLGGSETWAWSARVCVALGMALAYMALYALRAHLPRGVFSPPGIIGAGMAAFAGTALLAFPLEGAGAGVALALAGMLCGVSSALLMLGGNRAWARLRPERVMQHVTLSALAAVVLNYLLLVVPPALACVLVCLLPLAGALILARTRVEGRPRPVEPRDADKARTRGLAVRMAAHVASFGLVMGCMVAVMCAGELDAALMRWNVFAMAGALVLAVVGVGVAVLGEPARLLTLFSRAGLPLMEVGLILLCVVPAEAFGPASAPLMAGFVAADLFTWFLNSELVARSGKTSLEVLARSAGVQWLAFAAGLGLGHLASDAASAWLPGLFAACALLLVAEQALGLTPIHAARLIADRHDPLGDEGLHAVCASMAASHGLTARELEVLELLAHGRNVPYIQEALGISQGTAKTHAHNIYRKLAVASRQELLDAIDHQAGR